MVLVESKRWPRRGEEPYSCNSCKVTTPDAASAPLSARNTAIQGMIDGKRQLRHRAVMRKIAVVRWLALLVPILVGLVVSTLLLVDYIRPAPVFCAYDGGCDAVKRTSYAAILGIPTPVFGIATYALFATLALMRGARARAALFAVSALAAAGAVFLISVQVSLGVYCLFCMTVDVATLLVLIVAFLRFRAAWDAPLEPGALRPAAALACALCLVAPLAIGFVKKANVPDAIAREIARTPPGKVTLVDFVDFECPYCRETHAEIAPVVESRREHLRMVRKNVPLTRIHPHAMDAARAACCGEALGKGDAMADALFTAPVEELTPEGCLKIARSLGLDENAFKACLTDVKTEERIKADSADFKATHGHGLPTLWVDEERLEGAQEGAPVGKAIDRAIARKQS